MEFLNRVSDMLGLQWAPRDIPMSRRLQTLAAASWICFILFGQLISLFLFVKLLYSDYWWIALLYGAWMINDIDICHQGGRKIEWVRNWTIWQYLCDYFPIKLIKTTDLDPSKNYLFACYPHGLISLGACGAFGSNALDFYKKFPGLTCNMITLAGHFSVPFFRDMLMAFGACSATRESLMNLLDDRRRKGNCAVLMVGGASEALDSHPGEYKVVLSRRKGFIRVAMQSGAHLVPVISFGETDAFKPLDNSENTLLRKIQEKFRQLTGISPIFPIGRGIFQYNFGILPLRTPISVVVGAPIEIKKILEPSEEEVNAVHVQFTETLTKLFETEKSKYLQNHKEARLVIT